MLGNEHFYNRTIRKVVVAFGTIFNDIDIIRFEKDGTPQLRMKVPISYGAKEKYLTRLTSDPTLTKSINTLVPRISFNLDSINYDISRKQQTTLQNFSYTSAGGVKSQYAPIPYNFDFSLSIYVRHTEDGTQILEQILPFFTPDFTVTVDFINSMCQKYDMPIILNSVTNNTDYEGDMMTTRLIIWDLQFTAKGYIWPPVKGDRGLIGQYSSVGGPNGDGGYGGVIVNLYDKPEMNANTQVATVKVWVNPIDSQPDDEYGYTEYIEEFDIQKPDDNVPLPGSGAYLYDAPEPAILGTLGTPFNPGGGVSNIEHLLSDGLYRKKYDGYFADTVTWFDNRVVVGETADSIVSFNFSLNDDLFSMQWLGYFKPPVSGNYNFWLVSDDASYFWIGSNALSGYTTANALVNDGSLHPNVWAYNGNSVILDANKYYPVRIQFGEQGSYETMQLFYNLAGQTGSRNFNGILYHNIITKGF